MELLYIYQMNGLDFNKMTVDELTIAIGLDKEERELLESIKNDEWVSIPNEKEEIKHLQEIARSQSATQRIEVEMSKQDADKIYDLANQLDQSVFS